MKEVYSKENLKGYFYRNKNYILFVIALFAISLIVGYVFRDLFADYVMEAIRNMAENISSDTASMTMSIFLNNLKVAIIIILLGLLFSIFSLMILFTNGVLIGFMFTIVPAPLILTYTIPHGIFEIPQLILTVVCALLVTKLEINLIRGVLQRDKTFRGELENSSTIIKDIILSFTIIVVLLVIAALIEGYVTPVIGNAVISMMGISI
ncbi:MAG: stage II sporulation protein M [Methanosphaera sp.]|nr:stage II sporulation protein M [Methanosphaera sp.]